MRSGLRSSGSLSDALCAILRPANTEKTHIFKLKVKVYFTFFPCYEGPRESRHLFYSFFNLGSRWGGWSNPRPSRFIYGKETRNRLYRKLGGFQGLSGGVPKISSRTGFDPRTVQPVTSRYNDALRAHIFTRLLKILKN